MYLSEIYNLLNKSIDNDYLLGKVKIDSRLINTNDIFLTINDGYKYIKDAIDRGCKLIITDKDIDTNINVLKVDNTISFLGILSKYIRSKYKGYMIAITGSNGKTTTKEILYSLLSFNYKVLKNNKNYNNHIGVPSTILELDNSYDYCILELGTNHLGEIKYLKDIVKPDLSIITNIGYNHIGNFGSRNNILKEKIDIKYKELIVNGEDKLLNKLDSIKVYKKDYNYNTYDYLKMDYYLAFKVCDYLNIKYDINNINIDTNSRLENIKYNNITIIDDTYNASLESMIGGLSTLDRFNNKLIILGDILELGSYSKKIHSRINKYIKKLNNYYLITIGKYTKYIESDKHFNTLESLKCFIKDINYNNYDVIYIKGSHKVGLIEVVDIIKSVINK